MQIEGIFISEMFIKLVNNPSH